MISVEEVIARAAFDLTSIAREAADFSPAETPTDGDTYRFYQFTLRDSDTRPPFQRTVKIKDVIFPLGEGAVYSRLLYGTLDQRLPCVQLCDRCH